MYKYGLNFENISKFERGFEYPHIPLCKNPPCAKLVAVFTHNPRKVLVFGKLHE